MSDKAPSSRLRPRVGGRPLKAGRRNIYVSDDNLDLWGRAQQFALKRGVSLTSVLMDALARYLADPPKPEER